MFDHKKLRMYQEALAFATWVETILERAKKSSPLYDQLDRARTSILLNIAEGNGRFTAADRCGFLTWPEARFWNVPRALIYCR